MKLPERNLQVGVAIGIASPARGAVPAHAEINQIPIHPMKKNNVFFKSIAVTFAFTAISTLQGFSEQFQIDVKPGLNLIGNHLNVGNNNFLNEVLTTASGVLPDSKVYKWINGSPPGAGWPAVSNFELVGSEWKWSIDYTLAPGEGLFLESPGSTTLTIQGAQAVWHPVDASDPNKFYFLSDQHLPVLPATSSTYEDIFGAGAVPDDFQNAWLWNGDSQQWQEPSLALGGEWWPPLNVPVGHAVVIGGVPPPSLTIPEPGVFGLWLCGIFVAARRRR